MRLHWKIESHRLKLQLKRSFSSSAIVSNLMLCSPLWLSIHTRIKVLIGPGRKQRLNKWTSAKLWVTCRPAPITGQFLRGHLTKARELTGLNMWCPRRSWGSAGPQASAAPSAPGSPTSSSYTDSEHLPLCSPRQHTPMCAAGPPGEGFVSRAVSLWEEIVKLANSNKLPHPQPPPCWFSGWNLCLTHCHWTSLGPQRPCW